jgi:hypothetical protein
MHMHITKPVIVVLLLSLTGCAAKTVGFTAAGAAAGAGVGYSLHKDTKETVIGGLAGGTLGAVVGGISDHMDKKNYKAAYDKGYNQAQVDVAVNNWEEKTGKLSYEKKDKIKHLSDFKVPSRKEDDVEYEAHSITLEDYR